jgi:hypothetical protein
MPTPTERIPLSWPDATGSLAWLKNSPVNCLVVNGSNPELTTQAAALGLEVMEANAIPPSVVAIKKAVWPKVPARRRGQGGGSGESKAAAMAAGPTGSPWVDSNGWISSLTHAKSPDKAVWICAEPPKEALRGEAYALAVADAAAYGSRWLISLEAEMRRGLSDGNSEALASWKKISEALTFFEQHKAWRAYEPVAKLGILSDFAGPNEDLGSEVLNLCNRRNLPYRVLDQSKVDATSLRGLKAIVMIQLRDPDAAVQQLMGEFMRGGGLVIAPASYAQLAAPLKPAGDFDNRYNYFAHGEGRVAIARKPWTDPYQLATDTHLLLSRRNDVIRLWNAGSTNVYYTRSSNGKGLVQVINYATRSFGSPVSLYVAHPYKSAQTISFSGVASEKLTIERKADGVEVNLPPFPVYAAIEFGD